MFNNEFGSIEGKWSKKKYLIIDKLGEGAIGQIYLVQDEMSNLLALKIGTEIVSLTKEYNFLKKFCDKNYFPHVYDLDDAVSKENIYHYFTMEYINGYTLKNAIVKQNLSFYSKCKILCVITDIIKKINEAGYIYTDMKLENIMIDKKNMIIKLIDMGSIVKINTTVKEYTPMYDRLSWEKGNRVADITYQLFAVAILFITMVLGKSLNPDKDKLDRIMLALKKDKVPRNIIKIILMCIDGKVNNHNELYSEFIRVKNKAKKEYRGFDTVLNIMIFVLSIILIAIIRGIIGIEL